MIKFCIKNTEFVICFSFFTVIAVFCIIQKNFSIVSAFSVCFIHEIGHLIPITIFGEKIKKVEFSGMGIRIVPFKNPLRAYSHEIIILLGGATANFIIALFLFPYMREFAVMNIVIGIFNLLPYKMADGGAVVITVSESLGISDISKVMRIISILTSVFIILFTYFSGISNFTLILTIIYLTVVSLN